MTQVFATRNLSETFCHRNVVTSSSCITSKDGKAKIVSSIDFGKHGVWDNRLYIELDKNKLFAVSKAVSAYIDDLLEQIGTLDDILVWATKGKETRFDATLLQDKPMYFHGVKNIKGVLLKIFGEGMYDLEISWSNPKKSQEEDEYSEDGPEGFVKKITSIRDALAKHIDELTNANLALLFK